MVKEKKRKENVNGYGLVPWWKRRGRGRWRIEREEKIGLNWIDTQTIKTLDKVFFLPFSSLKPKKKVLLFSNPSSMASPLFLLFLFTISFSIPSQARPCKSLFLSFSLHRHRTLDSPHPFSQMAIIVDITEFKSSSFSSSSDPLFPSVADPTDILRFDLPRPTPVSATTQHFPYDFTSLRDRTKDILSVVVALLFGVGCGALTAATMYLAYSLFAGQFGHRSSVYDDFGEDDDDLSDDNKENIKKMGYINIPDDVAPVKSVV